MVVEVLWYGFVLQLQDMDIYNGKTHVSWSFVWPRSLASETQAWVKLVTVGFKSKTQTQGAGWCEDHLRIAQIWQQKELPGQSNQWRNGIN